MSWTDINFNESCESDSSSDLSDITDEIKSEDFEDYDLCEDINMIYKSLDGQQYHFSFIFDEQSIKDTYIYEKQNNIKKVNKLYDKLLKDNDIKLGGNWIEIETINPEDAVVVAVDVVKGKLIFH